MADDRPTANIDTGYIMNPKWFQVRRAMQDAMPQALPIATPDSLHGAVRTAMQAHLASILYCTQNHTDGLFPVAAIKVMCAIQGDLDEAAITALFTTGMWINHKGGMAEVRDYLKHNMSASRVKAQAKARSDAGKKGAAARWANKQPPAEQTTSSASTNGTRIKPDWMPSQTVIQTLKDEYPNLDLRTEHANFIDYWLARPGKQALKLDWDATWRIWMRKEGKALAEQQGRAPRRNQSQIVADNLANAQERDAASARALIEESNA